MNANLELTISCSTARGATIAMAWEIMEIAVAPMIEKKYEPSIRRNQTV
jgi:hypothetical protein